MQDQFESEMDEHESDQFEFTDGSELSSDTETESAFDEVEEMELAAGLLEITDERELDQFLGNLIKRVGRAVGQVVRSPLGSALGGILKGAAKKALPFAGSAIGGYFGGPTGAQIGGKLSAGAGRLFGLELEGLSPEDQEFEVARQFVRFAGETAKNAALSSPTASPQAAGKAAAVAAARRHAPGLLRAAGTAASAMASGAGRSGRWIRRGRNIIIVNCR